MKIPIPLLVIIVSLTYSFHVKAQWVTTTEGNILYYGGNVGIATNSSLIPSAKLHIKAGIGSYPQLILHEQGGSKSIKLGHNGSNAIIETGIGNIHLNPNEKLMNLSSIGVPFPLNPNSTPKLACEILR